MHTCLEKAPRCSRAPRARVRGRSPTPDGGAGGAWRRAGRGAVAPPGGGLWALPLPLSHCSRSARAAHRERTRRGTRAWPSARPPTRTSPRHASCGRAPPNRRRDSLVDSLLELLHELFVVHLAELVEVVFIALRLESRKWMIAERPRDVGPCDLGRRGAACERRRLDDHRLLARYGRDGQDVGGGCPGQRARRATTKREQQHAHRHTLAARTRRSGDVLQERDCGTDTEGE